MGTINGNLLDTMWDSIDSQLSTHRSRRRPHRLHPPLQQFLLTFLSRTILGAETSAIPEIENSGHIMLDKWLALQPPPVHQHFTTPGRNLPPLLLLPFLARFNAFEEGFDLFPVTLTSLGDQKSVHDELRRKLERNYRIKFSSFETVKEMDLINSFVYETLRLNPPVPSQFGRARRDFDLSSHNAVFEIKKGELLCGYQPVVMRDPKIFGNPEDFVYDRFSKKKGGGELLKYLYWSNGPQSGSQGPSASNKQCAARDTVPMTAAVFLAYLFQRYDNIDISSGSITALQKAK
ncbi:hypothetical protein DH2020_011553 [Rehmannia glutinosa]|uniref:Allene oxide synthase n=1 Tax=Rehmannia glutinosa TaxID=99300 RepID=A0ABR0XDM9_REHGL